MTHSNDRRLEILVAKVADAVARRYESVVTDNHHLSPELRAELVSLARNTMATMHRSVPAWYEKVGPSLEAILKIDIAAGTTLLIIMLVFAPMEGLLLKLIAIALLGAMSSAGIWVLSVALRETGPQVC